jgi:hypothetical protein
MTIQKFLVRARQSAVKILGFTSLAMGVAKVGQQQIAPVFLAAAS